MKLFNFIFNNCVSLWRLCLSKVLFKLSTQFVLWSSSSWTQDQTRLSPISNPIALVLFRSFERVSADHLCLPPPPTTWGEVLCASASTSRRGSILSPAPEQKMIEKRSKCGEWWWFMLWHVGNYDKRFYVSNGRPVHPAFRTSLFLCLCSKIGTVGIWKSRGFSVEYIVVVGAFYQLSIWMS